MRRAEVNGQATVHFTPFTGLVGHVLLHGKADKSD
jgi:hypothetical protein